MNRLFITALSNTLLLYSTAVWACTPEERCDVEVTQGEIPCVTVSANADECGIIATLTCPSSDAPTLTLDDGQFIIFEQITRDRFYIDSQYSSTRTITWSRGEEQGEVEVLLTDLPYEEDPCGGCY